MGEIVFFGGLILLVVLGPWILVWVNRRGRKREREEDRQRWGDLTQRIYALERAVGYIARAEEQTPTTKQETATPPAKVAAPPKQSAPAPSSAQRSAQPTAEAWVRPTPPPRPPQEPVAPPSFAPPVEPPPFTVPEPMPSLVARFKSALDIEETLGTNWLNKLGVSIIVLGIAFVLADKLQTMGPAGKVLIGYVVSAVMLGAGIWFERNDRYRILARAGIGGGWALLFFTTYAMYHVQAARVLTSQSVDLILLLAVAAVMVWHTLRYRSQVVTGLAFLLAFLTVTISHDNVYSLSAGGVLAAALVVIVVRMQWFELEVFGILFTYLNHYLWLRPIIEPMQGHRRPFPEFAASAAMLVLYWLIFRVSYVVRRPSDNRHERISTVAALLNTALLLALFKYQSTHPEWAFWALLAIGGIETALAQLPITRRRRTAVIVLNTLGVTLLIAAFPFRYSGSRLSVLWLLEAEALLLIGVGTREIIFRRLGLLAAGLVAGQMISVDAAVVCGRRMDGADVRNDFPLATMFAVAAAVFYANAHWVYRRWEALFIAEFDRRVMQRLSYVAALMSLVGAWIAFPEAWTAVAWCALGLALAWAGRRFAIPELGYQAHFLAAASVLRVLFINLDATGKYHGATLRLLTISLVAVLLYVSSQWKTADNSHGLTISNRLYPFSQLIGATYTWSASFLLALLAWYELRSVGVAVAWVMGGLVLLEIGLSRKSLSLRMQAYVAFAAGFLRMFFLNLSASGDPGEISPRFYTVVPLALAFFYGYWRLNASRDNLLEAERTFKVAEFCCYLGTITLASLMRFEVVADWVAAAWAALVFALLAVAWRTGRRIFLHQGILIAFGVLFRSGLHNFYQRSYFPASGWDSRWICVGAVVALLFASLPLAFRLRKKGVPSSETGLARLLQLLAQRPEQVIFFIAVTLLTVLLTLEMRHGMVTVSWGVEGVAIFLLALWLGERSFRLTGLGLLLLCVAKILLVDVWRIDDPQARYLTLIIVGAALLLVSFLYTRNREAIRRYL